MQQQYATISVSNHGAVGCWLLGYAQVVLVANGAPIGRPATTAGTAQPAVFLTAGHGATASLQGPSNCSAGVSDHVRVSPPGGTSHTDIALPMRACALTIGAFRAT